MVPEDLLFWIAPLVDAPVAEPSVLCKRHADAMVVPKGWTLDDRRENALRLFKPRPVERQTPAPRASRRQRAESERPEQLQIDGTGEIVRPSVTDGGAPDDAVHDPLVQDAAAHDPAAADDSTAAGSAPVWEPEFDHDDDLDGLLEVTSPLLARAFRGTGRPRP